LGYWPSFGICPSLEEIAIYRAAGVIASHIYLQKTKKNSTYNAYFRIASHLGLDRLGMQLYDPPTFLRDEHERWQ
jgi:hypothetical protein